jgi:hypothetical protein
LKNVSKIVALYGVLAVIAWAAPPTGITIQGNAQTSNLDSTRTLGSANIQLKIALGPLIQLQCGILGVLQGQNSDGTLLFQHTVTCNDRSIFALTTHTVISKTADCTLPARGIVGTFHEDSSLVGLAGPYAGGTGQVTIDGAINCGFNTMTIAGLLNPAP